MGLTRREFVKSVSLTVAAAATSAAGADDRLPLAFSTLGCPAWPWSKVLEYAAGHGFAAIELRGLEGNLDLPSHAAFAAAQMARTRGEIRARGLRIACVSSSARMDESDPTKRKEQMSDARRFIDLAAELESPYVRVFPTGSATEDAGAPTEGLRERVAAGLKDLGDYAGRQKVTVILESHDNLVTSAALKDVLQRADSAHVGLLWDAHHTFASGKEDPEFTAGQLGKWIRHTHLKDSVTDGKDRRYVLTGRGDVPIRRQVAALHKLGYKGFFCFEWEKVWHPELADPEVAFADYARVMTQYLRGVAD